VGRKEACSQKVEAFEPDSGGILVTADLGG